MLVATMTFAIVFFPVVFLSGLAKFLFTPLAWAATMSILASYLLAITLVPAYCAKFLKVSGDPTHKESTGAFAFAYQKFLSGLLHLRYPVALGSAALFVLAVLAMTNQMGQELFPQVDAGQVSIFVRMPTGTQIGETEKAIEAIEKEIIEVVGEPDPTFAVGNEKIADSNLQILISNIGVLMDWPAAYTPNSGSMDAFVLIQTKSKKGMPGIFDYVTELRSRLNAKFPEVEFSFDTGGMLSAALNMGEPSPIHFQVQGPKIEVFHEVAKTIVETAKSVPGTADVRIAQRLDYPTLEVKMDRELAAQQGLDPEGVMKNLVSATNSSINFKPSFWIDKKNGNHYFLGVQYWEKDLNSIETLLNIPVGTGTDGRPKRLRNFATIKRGERLGVVNHRNITRVIDVYANVLPGYDIGSVVSQIEAKLAALGADESSDERGQLYRLGHFTEDEIRSGEISAEQVKAKPLADGRAYKGISFRMMGEVRSMRDSFEQFTGGLAIAAVLVYLLMVAQFRSFIDPLIVMLTVPLGFIGVVAMLMATNTNLSIMAFMGIIMMVGIVVEYSIVLVDFANRRLAEGLSIREAILDAAKVRLRPILMTSLTTWLALLPMAIGFGGAEANAPLARAIIGGVLGATVLSLLVVPCLYVILKRQPQSPQQQPDAVVA